MSSTSIGKTVWTQSLEENDPSLEVRVPVILPIGVRTKELTILIKEKEVLCIKYKDSVLVQWRLYSKVSDEVEWRAEEDSVVVDLQKSDPTSWPSLLNLPMRADDHLLATEVELDEMFKREVKPLPPVKQEVAVTGDVEVKEEDLDRLLEETVQEVEQLDIYVKAELKGMEEEENEIRAKLKELEETASVTESEEEKATALKQIGLLEKMIEIHTKTRQLRTLDCTLNVFLQTQMLDLCKSRVNIGELSESETEAYLSEDEKELTPHMLLTVGVKYLQDQELEKALHFLRLAAVHHKHPQSISILFRIYTELGSPRGAFLLLQRAKDDEDLDMTTNLQVAEMFDRGARHFPPIFPAAIHFYQRAARCGSTHAMLGLAQLYLRGSTSATTLNETERKVNINMSKYHSWLQQALDRGSGAAYFIKGCMHLRGEHGLDKSYKLAKEYIDKAARCQPEITRRAVGVNAALEKLRIEEDAANDKKDDSAPSPATPASPSSSPLVPRPVQNTQPKFDAASRIAALEEKSAAANMEKKSAPKKPHAASGARSRVFWERATVTGVAVYAAWTLAFPIRVILLPHFYGLVQWFVESFGIGGSSPQGLMM